MQSGKQEAIHLYNPSPDWHGSLKIGCPTPRALDAGDSAAFSSISRVRGFEFFLLPSRVQHVLTVRLSLTVSKPRPSAMLRDPAESMRGLRKPLGGIILNILWTASR